MDRPSTINGDVQREKQRLKVFPHTILEPSRDALMMSRTVSTVKWNVAGEIL
ncbi:MULTISPECIES: hypothetical protein [unclassified Desulfosporosinus]|uniref:hypothetical protein n=1 Tax=unclassified Desulfosporosinus TaxID=2633794 RepID=UPI0002E33D72|nr:MULTISPECIES: hypothetical protein [unclassified Desulfosporosinus]ODA39815.1 hypothetical protein DSBG_3421 [Desulfosporosinus sp. BG]